jgi:hypothetical protein
MLPAENDRQHAAPRFGPCCVRCRVRKKVAFSSTLGHRRNFIKHRTKSSNNSLERAFFALQDSIEGSYGKILNFLLRPTGNRVFITCHSAQKRNFPFSLRFRFRFEVAHVQLYFFYILQYLRSPAIFSFSVYLVF